MERRYRRAWNRGLRGPGIVRESSGGHAETGPTSGAGGPSRARRHVSIVSIGLLLGLAGATPPGWAATCTPATIADCSAAGGNGNPNRSGNGGSGNGGGGGGSALGGGGVTIQIPGDASSGGTGGDGAINDSGQANVGGAPGGTAFGDVGINGNIVGQPGHTDLDGFNFGGGGGGGGAGFYSGGSSVQVGTGVVVQGGQGGEGGAGTSGSAANGGGGGGGGAALIVAAPGTATNLGTLIGGDGGIGGAGGNPGGGGGGGDGLLTLRSGIQVTNVGAITGGMGGAGGGSGTTAGASGAGVNLAGGSGVLMNYGTITGGAANGGAAGVGVIANGDVIVNGGTIGGGLSNDGVTRAAAIQFNGADNVLQLASGGTFVGDLEVAAGAGVTITAANTGLALSNNITLGDATSQATFGSSTANLLVSGVISGAGKVGVSDSGVITLTGDNTYTGDTTVDTGTLQIGNGGSTGSVAGNIDIVHNGTLIFNRGDAVAYAGNISGTGNLVQAGAGTLTISGAGSYSGSTTINAGTLALSGTGSIADSSVVVNNGTFDISATTSGATVNVLSGTGAVALGGQTLTIAQASGAFDGSIGGTGGLTLGGGAQTLSAANAYTGATTINAGTLALSGAGSIAASSGVVDNGTFDISATASGATVKALSGTGAVILGSRTLTLANANGAFGGAISGAGGLTLDGGTQTLSGANTYTGATTVNAGTLALSGAGRLPAATAVILAGPTATLDLSGGGDQTVAHLSGAAGSRLALGARTLTLADDTSQTFNGTLAGSGGLIKQGAGMLTLNGDSSAFSGTTTVAAGALAVGDAANPGAVLGGSVQVGAQGTVRGHGTILGDLSSSGVVAPGGSIGTLAVGGNYTQAAGATLSIEVSPTEASQLRVGGAAALDGTLAVLFDPGTYTARRYTVLSAANGVTGRFANVSTATGGADLGALRSTVSYGANAVDLSLANPADPSDPAAPGDPTGPVIVAPAMTSIYTAVGTTALLQAQGTSTALLARLSGIQDAPAGSRDVWIMPIGSRTKVGGTNGEPGFLTHAYGFLAGGEGQLGKATLGAAGGYTHTTLGEDDTGASGAIDTLRMAFYGMHPAGPFNLSATLGYGLDFLSQKRPFGGVGTAEGDHIGQELTAAAQASLPLQAGGFRFAPLVGLRYAYVHANGFGENGANGQDLQVGTDNARSLQSYVGITVDKAFDDAVRPVNMQLRLGYAHELLDASRVVQVQSEDGTGFAAAGTHLPRSFLTAGASIALQVAKATSVSVGVDAVINTSHVSAQSGYVRVNHRF